MERLTERYNDGQHKGILVKEKCGDGVLQTIYEKFGDREDGLDCEEGYLAMEKLADYEDAEEQGLLLRLPCPIGCTIWGWEYPTRIDEDGTEWTICDRKKAKVVPKKFHLMMLNRIGDMYFLTKEEAEQALKQMGE